MVAHFISGSCIGESDRDTGRRWLSEAQRGATFRKSRAIVREQCEIPGKGHGSRARTVPAALQNRPNQQTTNTNSPWLFPGNLPGQNTHPEGMLQGLRNWGIDLSGVRNTALRDLARELDPTALADSLGYSSQTIYKHAAAAAALMSDYAELKASDLADTRRD